MVTTSQLIHSETQILQDRAQPRLMAEECPSFHGLANSRLHPNQENTVNLSVAGSTGKNSTAAQRAHDPCKQINANVQDDGVEGYWT